MPLSGGLLNRVWRVPGVPAPVVVKHAPEKVGAMRLDPSRLLFEARALGWLAGQDALAAGVRTPRLLDVDAAIHTFVMEDAGALPALDAWLPSATPEAAGSWGAALGRFVGALHAATAGRVVVAEAFNNLPIQQTRLNVQYASIGASLAGAGVEDAAVLGRRAAALGERLLRPGRCLVMGDLWPRSVLVEADSLWLIDWEMVHYGQPFQDTAHLMAHLWMLAHRLPQHARAVRAFARAFLSAYYDAAPPVADVLDGWQHAGCEIAVRVLGPFQNGFLYERCPPEGAAAREALQKALCCLRTRDPDAATDAFGLPESVATTAETPAQSAAVP